MLEENPARARALALQLLRHFQAGKPAAIHEVMSRLEGRLPYDVHTTTEGDPASMTELRIVVVGDDGAPYKPQERPAPPPVRVVERDVEVLLPVREQLPQPASSGRDETMTKTTSRKEPEPKRRDDGPCPFCGGAGVLGTGSDDPPVIPCSACGTSDEPAPAAAAPESALARYARRPRRKLEPRGPCNRS